jgi:hypothetical protein
VAAYARVEAKLAEYRWSAEHDALTGPPHRVALERRFEQDRAAGRPVAVMLLDVDGFKQVNDSWGHKAGDSLLKVLAGRLGEAYGSDKFAGGGWPVTSSCCSYRTLRTGGWLRASRRSWRSSILRPRSSGTKTAVCRSY